MKEKGNFLSGNTTMLILGLLEKEDMYGYQMIETLKGKSENIFDLKTGTLYPILHELEKQGMVTSYEAETEGKRVRKYYHITKAGKRLLAEKKKEWNRYTKIVNQVIGVMRYAAI